MKLEAKEITKQYMRESSNANFFMAINKTDFVIESGELDLLLGRSGSGKTTFLNILAGILNPSEGKVFLDDEDMYAMSDGELSRFRNTHIGMIPQGQSAIHSLTVLENILLPSNIYAQKQENEGNAHKRAYELMERLDIENLVHVYPKELSGGELRRMAIARALVANPDFILADEPTGDLDDETTRIVLELLSNMSKQGKGVLIVSHEEDAKRYADCTYRMNSGEIKVERL